jgi:uncharacterized protein
MDAPQHSPASTLNVMKPDSPLTRFPLFLSCLLTLWTLRVVLLSPLLNPATPNAWQDAGNIVVKWLVWVLPVCIVLLSERVNVLEFLRLRPNVGLGLLVGLGVGLLYALGIVLVEIFIGHKEVNFSALLTVPRVFISAAFPEELLFRGYVLRRLESSLPFWLATFLTALLFLVFHLPGWFYYNLSTVQVAVSVLGVGLVGGILVRRTNSLWSAVLFHTLNNVAVSLMN